MHTGRSLTENTIPYVVLIQFDFWWWCAQSCSKHVEDYYNNLIKQLNCASSWSFTQNHVQQGGIKVKYYFWWFLVIYTENEPFANCAQMWTEKLKKKYILLVSELSNLYLPIQLQRKCGSVVPWILSRYAVCTPLLNIPFHLTSECKSRRCFNHCLVLLAILPILTINIICQCTYMYFSRHKAV